MKTEIKIENLHMDMGDPESISKCESMLKKMTTDGWTVIDVMFDRHLYMTTYRLEKELNAIEGYSDSELRAELTRRGYYTENLWTTTDVTGSHSCSEKEAQSILDKVMQSEWLVSNIFDMIEEEASDLN